MTNDHNKSGVKKIQEIVFIHIVLKYRRYRPADYYYFMWS